MSDHVMEWKLLCGRDHVKYKQIGCSEKVEFVHAGVPTARQTKQFLDQVLRV